MSIAEFTVNYNRGVSRCKVQSELGRELEYKRMADKLKAATQ